MKNWIPLLAIIYVLRHDLSGDMPIQYEGQSQAQITANMDGVPFDVVDKAAYDQAVANLPIVSAIDSGPSLEDRVAALEQGLTAVAAKDGVSLVKVGIP